MEAHMTSAGILPLAIMFAATSMFGQSLTLPPRIDPSKCPVGLEAEQDGSLFVYKNAKSDPAGDVDQRFSKRFDFKVTNFLPHDIVAAEITAHGFSYKGRIIPISDATPNIWKTVDIALDVKGNSSASREVSFARFSTIRTMEVNSVTYADGSTWRASSPGACSVAPNLLMRISAQ
jgi:hypothetical protein